MISSSFLIKNPYFLLLIDKTPHSAKFNMEFDIHLFYLVKNKKINNIFRIYRWKNHSITYGKFQDIKKILNINACKKDKIEIVKRPTGGRAILHYNDITFTIIFSNTTISPFNFKNSFLFVSDLINNFFSEIGINSNIKSRSEKYYEKGLCFQSITQYELVDENNNKLIGIAQYFTDKAVLIQGSIPFKKEPLYPKYFLLTSKNFHFENTLTKKNMKRTNIEKFFIKSLEKKLHPYTLINK